jgi:hypothetical protein
MCSFYHNKVLKQGLYQVIIQDGKAEAFTVYQGGGRQIINEKSN